MALTNQEIDKAYSGLRFDNVNNALRIQLNQAEERVYKENYGFLSQNGFGDTNLIGLYKEAGIIPPGNDNQKKAEYINARAKILDDLIGLLENAKSKEKEKEEVNKLITLIMASEKLAKTGNYKHTHFSEIDGIAQTLLGEASDDQRKNNNDYKRAYLSDGELRSKILERLKEKRSQAQVLLESDVFMPKDVGDKLGSAEGVGQMISAGIMGKSIFSFIKHYCWTKPAFDSGIGDVLKNQGFGGDLIKQIKNRKIKLDDKWITQFGKNLTPEHLKSLKPFSSSKKGIFSKLLRGVCKVAPKIGRFLGPVGLIIAGAGAIGVVANACKNWNNKDSLVGNLRESVFKKENIANFVDWIFPFGGDIVNWISGGLEQKKIVDSNKINQLNKISDTKWDDMTEEEKTKYLEKNSTGRDFKKPAFKVDMGEIDAAKKLFSIAA